jgi:hypothetical protein
MARNFAGTVHKCLTKLDVSHNPYTAALVSKHTGKAAFVLSMTVGWSWDYKEAAVFCCGSGQCATGYS